MTQADPTPRTTHRRRQERRGRLGAAALAALALTASGISALPAAAAAAATQQLAGLTSPFGGVVLTGTATTATGALVKHLWVPDHLNGICRVDVAADGTATLNKNTCQLILGGAAIKPTQLAFDRARNLLYTGDLSAKAQSGLWRLRYDPAGDGGNGTLGGFSGVTQLVAGCYAGTAPDATALDASGNVYVGFKRLAADGTAPIYRISNAAGAPTCADVTRFGAPADGKKTLALAFAGSTLFEADGNGVAAFVDAATCTSPCTATRFGTGFIATPFSVTTDPVNHVLYAGDASQVWSVALDPATDLPAANPASVTGGFSFVFGLTADTTGLVAGQTPDLYVTDDPSNGITPGSGRLWRIPGSGTIAADTTAPSVPAGVKGAAVGSTQVDLSWTASTDNVGVASYTVTRDGTAVGTVTAGTAFSDTGLTPSSTHTYTVSATDAAGNASAASAPPVSVTTAAPPDTTAPTAPTAVTVTPVAGTATLTVSWSGATDNVGVTGYRVFRDAATSPAATLGGAASSWADTGVAAGSQHSYTVVALDAAGNASSPSTPVTGTAGTPAPPADTTPPTAPTGLSVSRTTATANLLRWTGSTDNVGVTSYRVSRDGVPVGSVAAPGTTWSDTGLSAGAAHTYSVVALDAAGNTSAAASFSLAAATRPGAPVIGTATSGSTADTIVSATARWGVPASDGGSAITSYRVLALRTGTTTPVVRTRAVVAGATSYTFAFSGLVSGATYTFTVQAVNVLGTGPASARSVTVTAR